MKGLLVIEFSKIQQWLAENLLTLNLDKTKFMCFSIYNKFLPNFQTINLHTFSCISNNYLTSWNIQLFAYLYKVDFMIKFSQIVKPNLKYKYVDTFVKLI